MSEPSQTDPFAALWQSAPQPDTRQLMRDLQRWQSAQRWHQRMLIAIICGIALFLVFEETTRWSGTHGLISVLWIAFVAGALGYQRLRCRAVDPLDLNTVTLLKRMIARAKRGLFQARCLYLGTPLGAVAGAVLMRVLAPGTAPGGHIAQPSLAMVPPLASLLALAAMIIAGLVLARARRRQLRELTAKLKSLEENL
ncbi:hypothetical protein [Dyella mobilis]|uniref:Uncharacterized protein n=1 Tax=Dyella mobilis TaxID=1849582 RepID=A0ABS2KL30_9GAMM|nr:hypothetical protein [Dyella mobilis]MBM7131868.1 hypothetical protein [Dyella mobilis]GLQ96149.1 hypothetical protein GCM10007863_05670 [Dyella mobilis]